jgi:hypothetical protein
LLPVVVGVALLLLSSGAFIFTLVRKDKADADALGGLDLKRVRDSNGVLSTNVSGCEIRVINGQIEECPQDAGTAVVLPCNEYFDDHCVSDTRSALGAYASRVFDGQKAEFVALIRDECRRRLAPGVVEQKTNDERAESFGAGRCLLLMSPLGRKAPIALLSTTTQRAGQGLASRISYLFDGMRELATLLADARINEVVMPILGAGHGQIDTPLAFVGLLLAVCEAARHGQGGQRLKRVTLVVFKRNADSPAEVDKVVVQRALALVGSRD